MKGIAEWWLWRSVEVGRGQDAARGGGAVGWWEDGWRNRQRGGRKAVESGSQEGGGGTFEGGKSFVGWQGQKGVLWGGRVRKGFCGVAGSERGAWGVATPAPPKGLLQG
ncbi:hypothetical protein KI387_022947, partial [Taxus chinensis]